MNPHVDNGAHFPAICIERCRGLCCDPWWGIISYAMVKTNGLSSLDAFRSEVIKGIKERKERITAAYVTHERRGRALFKDPEKYNVRVREVAIDGSTLRISIIAMFAFSCLYLSDSKACLIHPASLGGQDIRPPHCAALGSPMARPNEKGYCRIIHAGLGADGSSIAEAIDMEKAVSLKSYAEGVNTVEAAADNVIKGIKDHCAIQAPHLLQHEKPTAPGRNDPCWCGSSLKYKKCHGR